MNDPAVRLLAVLGRRGLMLATAESLTGGLVAAAITAVPGASLRYRGGAVAYATDVKARVLGLPADLLAEHGPVSAATASAMAQAAVDVFAADLGLATTGVAGPDPVGEHPPGTAYIAACLRGSGTVVRGLAVPGDRQEVRAGCVAAVLLLGAQMVADDGRLRE